MPPTSPISFKRRRWLLPGQSPTSPLPDPKAIAFLAQELNVSPLLASLLVRRGLLDPAAATAFLNPAFKTIPDPSLLPGIAPAVARLALALKNHHKIALFGDYDVDGITGTAMLWHTLKAAGATPGQDLLTYTPHRVEEGYGISCPAVAALIEQGVQLIITIDCGITAHDPISLARGKGVDVIITDHHDFDPTQPLPPAVAIVHPRLDTGHSTLDTPYPNPDLCGAGVAYKLAWVLAVHLCNSQRVSETYRNLLIEFTALVALATIADVVPLLGENRILVRYGLSQLPRCTLPGVRALINAAGYGKGPDGAASTRGKIDGTAVGFSLAPRLNAAGRMDHAAMAVELFTSADPARAAEIAGYLEDQNRSRQATEKEMFVSAKAQIDAWLQSGQELPYVIVVDDPDHHAGVVGIVASRIVDMYNRPAFVLAHQAPVNGSAEAAEDPTIQHSEFSIQNLSGSARSIPGFDLHLAIDHCRHLLTSGGGHAMAGGVRLPHANLPAFRAALDTYARTVLTPDHFIPTTLLDAVLPLADATVPLVTSLAAFEPFGRENPHPKFLVQRARLTSTPRPVGAAGAHLQLQFSQKNVYVRGIAFKTGPLAPALHVGQDYDLIVEPKLDHYTGAPRVDFIITDLARTDGVPFDLPAPSV